MSPGPPLHAFAGYGIELEYMIVDQNTLSVMPVADALLHAGAGKPVGDVARGRFGWSNEMVMHLVEIKNPRPEPTIEPLGKGFQDEINAINPILQTLDARLMPTAMHPWMNPVTETQLWPHENASIYQAYDRLFGCRQHGQANLQSMHVNLPFADDAEFARLHAAVRLVVPILPALAASSPVVDGGASGFLDTRMEAYRGAARRVPAVVGKLVPETINSRAEYEARVLSPLYRDVAALDPLGVLQHEWLNGRAAIPRFARNAIEIRIIDTQECPQADLAIATATVRVIQALYDGEVSSLAMQQAIGTDVLATILDACVRDAEQAVIDNAAYLRLLGIADGPCQARELWQRLIETTAPKNTSVSGPLRIMLEQGPLARRILRAAGKNFSHAHLHAIYAALCDCLAAGRMFSR